jgi:hypothetical protein
MLSLIISPHFMPLPISFKFVSCRSPLIFKVSKMAEILLSQGIRADIYPAFILVVLLARLSNDVRHFAEFMSISCFQVNLGCYVMNH